MASAGNPHTPPHASPISTPPLSARSSTSSTFASQNHVGTNGAFTTSPMTPPIHYVRGSLHPSGHHTIITRHSPRKRSTQKSSPRSRDPNKKKAGVNKGVAGKKKQEIFICHHEDCRRQFQRKTSLTNHLKAHNNIKSRSIYRSKRAREKAMARLRAVALQEAAIAAAAAAAAAAKVGAEANIGSFAAPQGVVNPAHAPLPGATLAALNEAMRGMPGFPDGNQNIFDPANPAVLLNNAQLNEPPPQLQPLQPVQPPQPPQQPEPQQQQIAPENVAPNPSAGPVNGNNNQNDSNNVAVGDATDFLARLDLDQEMGHPDNVAGGHDAPPFESLGTVFLTGGNYVPSISPSSSSNSLAAGSFLEDEIEVSASSSTDSIGSDLGATTLSACASMLSQFDEHQQGLHDGSNQDPTENVAGPVGDSDMNKISDNPPNLVLHPDTDDTTFNWGTPLDMGDDPSEMRDDLSFDQSDDELLWRTSAMNLDPGTMDDNDDPFGFWGGASSSHHSARDQNKDKSENNSQDKKQEKKKKSDD